jgi:hypothetical protein
VTGLVLKAMAAAGLLGLTATASALWLEYGALIALDSFMAFCF